MNQRTASDLVAIRAQSEKGFSRSFLRTVVCEFRFPTLMELGGDKPPASLVKALRHEYPILDFSNEVTLHLGSAAQGTAKAHLLRSSRGGWLISLRDSAISLEAKNYPGFDEFRRRVEAVVSASAEVIDAEFFTRVGLRYVNAITQTDNPVAGWVNGDLVAPVASGAFFGISESSGRLTLGADDGGCVLQYGLKASSDKDDNLSVEYLIDIDTHRTDVPVSDAMSIVDSLHAQAFSIFDWALGDKAKAYLNKAKE